MLSEADHDMRRPGSMLTGLPRLPKNPTTSHLRSDRCGSHSRPGDWLKAASSWQWLASRIEIMSKRIDQLSQAPPSL